MVPKETAYVFLSYLGYRPFSLNINRSQIQQYSSCLWRGEGKFRFCVLPNPSRVSLHCVGGVDDTPNSSRVIKESR